MSRWENHQISAQDTLLASRVIPDNKVHGANMGPTWVLSSPGGPHVGPMKLAMCDDIICHILVAYLIARVMLFSHIT